MLPETIVTLALFGLAVGGVCVWCANACLDAVAECWRLASRRCDHSDKGE